MTSLFVLVFLVCLCGVISAATGALSPHSRMSLVRSDVRASMPGSLLNIARLRSGASKSVTEVSDMTQFRSILSKAGKNKLVVVDFTATWCPPCKMIAPVYQSMAEEYPKAAFTKVNTIESSCDFGATITLHFTLSLFHFTAPVGRCGRCF